MKSLANAQDRAELLARLQKIEPGTRAQWGRMTAHQMICHLSDVLRMGMDRHKVRIAGSLLGRTLVKWIAIYAPLPWPRARLRTSRALDQVRDAGCTPPADFAADVSLLIALMDDFATRRETFEKPVHPLFGKMSQAEWLRWSYLHMDHHLRQFGV